MLSWRSIRLCLTAVLALTLALSGFLLSGVRDTHPRLAAAFGLDVPRNATPTPNAKPAPPAPVVHTRQTVVPSAPAGAARGVVAELPLTRTKSYGMVGVTWSDKTTETDITVKFRSLVKGAWTPWQTLGLDDTQPGVAGRPGTEPIWVGKAQGVAVRVSTKSGVKPADIKVVTIDPGGSTSTVSPASADTTGTATGVTSAAYKTSGTLDGTVHASTVADTVADPGDGTPSFTAQPTIISRASWGAGPGTTCDTPLTGNSTHGVIVHHTAGSNSYTKSESAQIVRGIQAYHTKGHGWCDIGYNFLVDKYGQIFEGRKGGIDRQVRAAHSGNGEVNTYDMGVSMMGDYDKVHLSPALESSMVKLIGWRLGTNYLKAKGTYKVKENNLTLNMISGHRNVIHTECPGRYGYAWLSEKGGLRDRVEAYISKYKSDIKTRAAALGTSVTGPVFIGEAETGGGRKTRFGKLDIYSKSGDGTRTVTDVGGFRTKYAAYGSQKSALGFPKSDSPTVTKNGTFAQKFEHGSIFATRSGSSIKLHALWGSIAAAYDSIGGASSKLGAPTTSLTTISGGTQVTFEKGYIRYSTSSKKTVAYTTSGSVVDTSTAASSSSDTLTVPSSGKIALTGRGFGHGIGMGQYGAQGAAGEGLTFDKILAFYYPGTTLAKKTGDIRVQISKNTGSTVEVLAHTGLVLHRVDSGSNTSLPMTMDGKAVDRWRILPNSSKKTQSTLQYRTGGVWHSFNKRWTADAQFEGPFSETLVLPNGSLVKYRGAMRSALPKSGATTRVAVNVLPIESYVRGVVAAEMPSSWKSEALKAQAVAARTYGVRSMSSSRYYDICDTTSCQVYGGAARETSATDKAVSATAGKIVTYGGEPALTQFSSSSGGYTVAGSQPYLKAFLDPYDGQSDNPNHVWTTTLTASTVQKAYPSIGTLKTITITKRDGGGVWGGRVTSLTLVGSKKSQTISGTTARSAFGLRSTWFRF